MKKLFLLIVLVFVISVFVNVVEKFFVVVMLIFYVEIFELIKLILVKEGVDLQIKVFIDYVQFNVQVVEKCLDVNYFQILLYLENFNKGKGINLVIVVGVYVEFFGGYLRKYKLLVELFDGVIVVIFNEGSNSGCVLLLLQKVGLFKLKDLNNVLVMFKDIVENLKNLKFKEFELVLLLCVLDQVDLDLININYVLEVKFNLVKDVLVLEDCDLFYVNYLVVCLDNKDSDVLKKFFVVLISLEVKVFIEKKYVGVVVLVF